VHEAAIVAADFRTLVGRVYLSPEAALAAPRILDPDRTRVLSALVDELIPGDEHWPPASATDAVRYIDAMAFSVPALRPILIRGIDRLAEWARERFGTAFEELQPDSRLELTRELELENPDGVFELVFELTCEAYYRDERVLEVLEQQTGFSAPAAMVGWEMEPFDDTLLDRVRQLPPRFRAAQ
jgi:hypothetical protein